MGVKMKTLTLTYLKSDYRPQFNEDKGKEYQVVQVEQSVDLVPGQYLSKIEVRDLCEMTGTWKIIIKQQPKEKR